MASYSNTTYSNGIYDLNGVYFNSTSQSNSSSAVDLDALDTRYLIKSSGGTISNNLIVAGSVDIQTSLTLPTIGNVEDTIQGKQDDLSEGTNISIVDNVVSCDLVGSTNIEITDGVISTTGLQEQLSEGANISIVDNVVSCDLVGSTNIDITDGVISTTGLATTTQLDTKQDEITTSTDLSCNSLNTNQLIVNDNLYFDTIVIRRPTGATYNGTDFVIALRELQCWVGGSNIMINGDIIPYFAEFT